MNDDAIFLRDEPMRILISGASGMIGSALAQAARAEEWDLVRLVRTPAGEAPNAVLWNPADVANPLDPARLENFDIVVHLSGANVAHRWTPEFKQEIVKSRVGSTQALCSALARTRNRPRVLLCASGSGIYGNRGDEILTEQSAPGSGFLADLCRTWEEATRPASDAGVRVVHLRCGIVLDPAHGALPAMLPPFRLGVGGWLGSGRQWMPWIVLEDAIRAILFLAARNDLAGPFNVGSPHPVTNREFARSLAHALHRPALFPVPGFVLRLGFAEFADEALLASQRMVPQRLVDAGFALKQPEIETALQALLR